MEKHVKKNLLGGEGVPVPPFRLRKNPKIVLDIIHNPQVNPNRFKVDEITGYQRGSLTQWVTRWARSLIYIVVY